MSNIDFTRIIWQPATVRFMEMHERPAAQPMRSNAVFKLLPKPINVSTYRSYYFAVGEKFQWLDRMVMEDALLFDKINADNIEIYTFHIDEKPAGYAEFILDKDFTEILYFGLMPEFVGKGWGLYFLNIVILHAWSYNPKWVQLNTCSLDHPNAINVYTKAGFKKVRTAVEQRRVMT